MSEKSDESLALDPEIAAIAKVYMAVSSLDATAQKRVLDYVARKLNVATVNEEFSRTEPQPNGDAYSDRRVEEMDVPASAELDGISPVAQRWIRRSDLSARGLSAIFSIGAEEIDLIAKSVPGNSKKERMRSTLLLKAMASYLASGAARASHKDVKEACTHYDGWDATNFATYLKSFSSEISGAKSTGYTLNARGMSSATELIKAMIVGESG